MKKTDKKVENKLRKALTKVCDFSLENIEGYQWISHQVNYSAFPDSLMISCAFASQVDIDNLKYSKQDLILNKKIGAELASINIKLNSIGKQITYIVA